MGEFEQAALRGQRKGLVWEDWGKGKVEHLGKVKARSL
jgi:hypothetical protein